MDVDFLLLAWRRRQNRQGTKVIKNTEDRKMKTSIIALLAAVTMVFGAGSARAVDQDRLEASFDRGFGAVKTEHDFDFTPVIASWERLLSEDAGADVHYYAIRSFSRMLGESVYTASGERRNDYQLALAGWEEILFSGQLERSPDRIKLAARGAD